MSELTGKHGLIVGVANKRSIAWAIAKAAAAAGARLAVTYQGERLEENVRDLAGELHRSADPAVRRHQRRSDRRAVRGDRARVRRPRLRRARRRVRAARGARRPFVETSREGFRMALDISAYSLIALARGALPLMEKRGGGSILTLTYLGSERVFPNYNVMGVAKAALEASVRYLASDLGPQNIRVNAISAGPIKTLAASGIGGFSTILQVYRERAPLRRNVETGKWRHRAFPPGPRRSRHHRRGRPGGRRLQHHGVLDLTPRFRVPVPCSRSVPRSKSGAAFLVRSAQVATASNAAGTPCALRHFACSLLRLEETA